MRSRWIEPIFAMATLLAFSPVILAQTAPQSGQAKTQAGALPDLSGVWVNITEPSQSFNGKVEPSLQPWAEAKYNAVKNDNPGDTNTNGRVDRDPVVVSCFPPGMPRILTELTPFEIVQVPGRVIFLFERDYLVRHIWTDGRKLPEDPDPTYMGYSIGKWDGDTLVVDTIGMKDTMWLDRMGHPHSEALHIVERIRRVDRDKLQIDWTFEDPKAFTKAWAGQTVYRYKPDWTLQEYISCGDRLAHGGESLEQKAAKQKSN